MHELALRALALDAPSAAFAATDGVARLLLALRIVLLMVTWLALVGRDDRAQRVVFAVACGLFVGSLAMGVLLVPFVVCAIVVCGRRLAIASSRARLASIAGAVVGIVALVVGARFATRPAKHPPSDAAGLTVYWLDRENLFEARLWAERWTGAERDDPRDAQLTLARIDWELGHREIARALLTDLVARSSSDDARRRATQQLETWGR